MCIWKTTYIYLHSHVVVDCGFLGNPGNGNVSLSSTTYNSTATYSCKTGYTLTGDDVRICLDSGIWSGNEPTCTGKHQQYCNKQNCTSKSIPNQNLLHVTMY